MCQAWGGAWGDEHVAIKGTVNRSGVGLGLRVPALSCLHPTLNPQSLGRGRGCRGGQPLVQGCLGKRGRGEAREGLRAEDRDSFPSS